MDKLVKSKEKIIEKLNEYTEKLKEEMDEEKQNKIKENIKEINGRITDKQKIIDDHEISKSKVYKSVKYYEKFINILKDKDKLEEVECPICLSQIDPVDIGITKCCHMYCYTCLESVIEYSKTGGTSSICASCKKKISREDVFKISKRVDKSVSKYGTKISYFLNYIKNNLDKYIIIFSSWTKILKEIGNILENEGINILYCFGSSYQKDNAIKKYMDIHEPDWKIMMLSLETSASGSDLSLTEQILFVDPPYGTKEEIENTKQQAIARAKRLGNTHEYIYTQTIIMEQTIEDIIKN